MPDVYLTALADRGAAALRGPARTAFERWLDDLAERGCRALGYRLAGDPPLAELCCKHLRGRDRAIVVFTGEEAWVLLVGPHNRQDQIADAYTVLYALVGHEAEALAKRTKPPCCGDDGQAPSLEAAEVDRLVVAAKELVRRR